MDSFKTDLVIIGAGIVGLATAMKAVQSFPDLRTVVLEKESGIAMHQTGHNSGVIHSGIYYRPGSLKAQLCVSGAAALLSFCREHDVAHDVCGKLIVATSELQLRGLSELQQRAIRNGISGVRWVKRDEIRDFEPHASGLAALYVPGTAIVDYKTVSKKYADILTSHGGDIRTNATVIQIKNLADRFVIETTRGSFETRFLINCAGLYSDRIASLAGAVPSVNIIPFRGEYYELSPEKRYLVRSLLYPVPDPRFPFLGVHFTRHLNGGIEAGPNAVLALRREGYAKSDFDLKELLETLSYRGFWLMAGKFWRTGLQEMWRSASQRSFASALRELVPEVQHTDLVAAGAGVRAQAVDARGVLLDDFSFVQSQRALHVCNVPSPAATASLAIADKILLMAIDQFGLKSRTSGAERS
jgi:(S)-2-hydroxyglutarate dehydrogenase